MGGKWGATAPLTGTVIKAFRTLLRFQQPHDPSFIVCLQLRCQGLRNPSQLLLSLLVLDLIERMLLLSLLMDDLIQLLLLLSLFEAYLIQLLLYSGGR